MFAGHRGGAGSGGAGGGGGAAGNGGHAYPIFHQGAVDLCDPALLTTVVRNTPGSPGEAGTPGLGGAGGLRPPWANAPAAVSVAGWSGGSASQGYQVDCQWSRPCTTSCGSGELCVDGWCLR